MCGQLTGQRPDSFFTPVEVIFDEEPYDVDVDPADEERELPFCDQIASIAMLLPADDLERRLDDDEPGSILPADGLLRDPDGNLIDAEHSHG